MRPAQAAGIGTLLGLKQDVIYQAVQQAVSLQKSAQPARLGRQVVQQVQRLLEQGREVLRGEHAHWLPTLRLG